ncbi:4-methylaminobutanoate oxidase (formaldehyde-forming) [Methylopila capsulata]|uniref:4-methylaminobutanoate oxidase (Formaldehyde-forming) n=1 Tax=Methylopila capsulata TaxID=61654 RepID=A0A9W6MT33_9HYPH|nr:FAD-dependent oxidoreductase [Methylopila capsulata]MBM7852472.1 4-methylaminobutanoate oxidase (formaldehyde-forming) [Methylopila capsulata]GLK56681.1 dehydrogenase [Methylopila capsulata]
MTEPTFPTQAEVVIIGGGIVGCSLAYHLTQLGHRDVVVLEQGRLSSGTTWHAAGLVGQLRSQASMTRLIRYSTELYARLEAETGLGTGWKQCGSVSVARTAERMTQLRRTIASARAQGVEIHELTPAEAGEKWPVMRTDDLVGGVWLPGDGKANPTDLTQALARGARTGGARIFEKTRVTGVTITDGRIRGVATSRGEIACETAAICAGQWSRQFGKMCGVSIPLHSAEHFYLVTERIDGVHPDLPVMRDPDGFIYFKEEVGGLVMGGFEPDAKPWGMGGIPDDFEFQLLPDDHDQFEILMENALTRVPALETAAIRTTVNGPESFTPDNNFLLGETSEVRGLFVGAGFNSAGIASAGGAGRALAEWIVAGEPTQDLWPVDIRRFAAFNANPAWLKERVKETLGLHYAMPWPNRELVTARPFRTSPVYERLKAKGAVFGSKMGWERANYFATGAHDREIAYGFGRPNWLEACAAEQRAAREAVALFDMTSFAKLRLEGPDSEAALQRLCAADMALAVGDSAYTPMLNRRAGIETEVTVARVGRDAFLIVAGSGQPVRDADWIRRHLGDARATLTDVTSAYAVLGLMGPRSRDLLATLTDAALDDAAFPPNAVREIAVGFATVLAARRSYAGELGYELTVATEFAAGVYDALTAAGAAFGLRDAGYYALDALRIEKGFRAWGRETSPDLTPDACDLGFVVNLAKGDFIGRDALMAARAGPAPTKRLVSLLGPEPGAQMAWGGELLLADDVAVGEVTSAAYGATLGGVVAIAWIDAARAPDQQALDALRLTIDAGGERLPVRASLKPFLGSQGVETATPQPLRKAG